MKTLYFVRLYNHRENEWVRIILTAESSEAATKNVEEYLEDKYWKVREVLEVCSTTDEVWMEV
jgi:hypothetical protein